MGQQYTTKIIYLNLKYTGEFSIKNEQITCNDLARLKYKHMQATCINNKN